MRSRALLNGFKWLASQRTQTVLKPCKGFASRAGFSDLQATLITERHECLYNGSRLILLPLTSRVFSSEALVEEKKKALAALKKLNQEARKDNFKEERITEALKKLGEGGKEINKDECVRILRNLRKYRKCEAALLLSRWMLECKEFEHVAGDYALHLDLIANVNGKSHAEKYFESLPKNIMRSVEVNSALLQCYVRKQSVGEAEEQFKKMEDLGLVRNEHCFNQIMELYMATDQSAKVLMKIKQMKEMNVLPDKRTYSLWLKACASVHDGIDELEKIVDEIKTAGENSVHWSTYITLANIYVNAGHVGRAESVVKQAEKVIPQRFTGAYDSVIHLYGALGKKDDVYRTWKSLKEFFEKPFLSSYESMLSSLVKVGDIEGAENLFKEWESHNPINCKLANILLEAYIRNGMLEKAEKLHNHISQKKCKLNSMYWAILTEGYLKSKKMKKAAASMKNALRKQMADGWHPKSRDILSILQHFAKGGSIKRAEEFIIHLRAFKCLTTEVYNLVLSTYVKAGKPAPKILEQMKKDSIKPDEETHRLLKLVNTEGLKTSTL